MLHLLYFSLFSYRLYSSYIFNIDLIMIEFMIMFVKYLALFRIELSGRIGVDMVSRSNLPVKTSYAPGREVDRRGDSPVESFVVLPPSVDLSWTRLLVRIYSNLVMSLDHG